MKYLIVSRLLFLGMLLGVNHAHAQCNGSQDQLKTYNLPASNVMFTSFYVNELDQVFIPVNGGIYLPLDSLWFIPPSQGYYFTSFAPNTKDTGFFALANSVDSTSLFYIKSSKTGPIKRHCILKLEKGIYNVIFTNNTCYVWGYNGKTSKIGVLLKNSIQWLISVLGVIRQVQITDSSGIYFTLNNSIYNLGTRQIVITVQEQIHGFCFDSSGNIIISEAGKIEIFKSGQLAIVADGLSGMLQYQNGIIYISSNANRKINVLSKY